MYKIRFNYLVIIFTLILLSCDSSDDKMIAPPESETADSTILLTATNTGEIHEIGYTSGSLKKVGQINKENNSSLIATSTLTATENNIYAIEYLYNPAPSNNLLIYNKLSSTSQIKPLQLPNSIPGNEKAIIALDVALNGSTLIGVLDTDILAVNSTKHIITINTESGFISTTGITFTEDKITSIKRLGPKLYVSTWASGFLEIDLDFHTVENLHFNNLELNGSRICHLDNSEIAFMQAVPNTINSAKPVILNPINQTLTDHSENTNYELATLFGSSLVKFNTYLNLVSTDTVFFGVLKTNLETNETELLEINSASVNRNMVILDILFRINDFFPEED